MSWGLIIVILFVIVTVLKVIDEKSSDFNHSKNEQGYGYQKKRFLITKPEHQFFNLLIDAVGSRYYIFPQIHLPSLVDHKAQRQSWYGAFRHINGKSVDFVLCDKDYISPILVIELDDSSHERYDRQRRDKEVERILNEAGIPLLRIMNNQTFDKEKVLKLIEERLESVMNNQRNGM